MPSLSIAGKLAAAIKEAEEYRRTHYGAVMGDDFPELANEVLNHPAVGEKIFYDFLRESIGFIPLMAEIADKNIMPSNLDFLKKTPNLYMPFLSWLYYGVQIGRELQKQEDAFLRSAQSTSEDDNA